MLGHRTGFYSINLFGSSLYGKEGQDTRTCPNIQYHLMEAMKIIFLMATKRAPNKLWHSLNITDEHATQKRITCACKIKVYLNKLKNDLFYKLMIKRDVLQSFKKDVWSLYYTNFLTISSEMCLYIMFRLLSYWQLLYLWHLQDWQVWQTGR